MTRRQLFGMLAGGAVAGSVPMKKVSDAEWLETIHVVHEEPTRMISKRLAEAVLEELERGGSVAAQYRRVVRNLA